MNDFPRMLMSSKMGSKIPFTVSRFSQYKFSSCDNLLYPKKFFFFLSLIRKVICALCILYHQTTCSYNVTGDKTIMELNQINMERAQDFTGPEN